MNISVTFATRENLSFVKENDRGISSEISAKKCSAGEYVVAEVQGEPVGFLRFGCFWSEIPFIEIIWVSQNVRRRGVAREMVRYLEHSTRGRGGTIIMSSSQADEPEAQAFHRGIGFRVAGALTDLRPFQDVREVVFVKSLDDV